VTKLLLIAAGALVLAAIVIRGFWPLLARRRRSSAQNNWRNEAFVAHEEAGSWTESEVGAGYSNTAPTIYPGINHG
jgi:FtsZ-interacting cell division protein ZipA